nr:reverse transcriptase domain-containing protein [Tanacetum cinerariifolium]
MFPLLSMKDISDEPLIIEAVMEGYLVRRVYVDQGASMEVIFEHCFKNLSTTIRSRLKGTQMDLVGFTRGVVKPLGKIKLEVVFGDEGLFRTVMINFTVFPTPRGIATLVTRSTIISECRRLERKQTVEHEVNQNINQEKEVSKRVDLTEQTLVNPTYLDPLITIRGNLSEQCKNQLRTLLKKNMNVFAWETTDMTGIPRRIIRHSLNVNPSVEPVAQKRRVMTSDRTQVVSKEMEEWVNAVIVHPVRYLTWISNPVLVKKSDGSWRMCIYFKNINSAYPKDYYPLPDIDEKKESVIKRNLEAYANDMVIKSNDEKVLIKDIAEAFDNLWRINMKLNPKKCSFGVEAGKFLRYMITSKGIQANSKKTKAIPDMQSSRTLKEMQSLSGKLATLKGFLSRSAEKSIPFFETQKGITKENKDEYRWTESTKKEFQEIKRTLNEAERNYALLEKLALSLLHMSRRLQRTNNEAKYEALLVGLRIARKMKVQNINVMVDSKLVVSQINESYVASNTNMIKYLTITKECIVEFETFAIQNIPRNLDQKADILSKLATHAFDHLTKKVLVEVLAERSTDRKEVRVIIEEEDNWMTPIIRCLAEGVWPKDKDERRALRMKINQYVLEEGVLFKKGYMVPMLRYAGPLQANYVISVTRVKHMPRCQGIQNANDFNHCSMAILPMGNGHSQAPTLSLRKVEVRHHSHRLLHKMDEAKPLARITEEDVKKFVWDNIVCQFGLP